ncbi:bifunctional glycosyltransferase/class I SAM-dependent methyltransferase [Novosphingobium sp. KCTC 2891]|uniref:bifunctional glycosyltransferase/class I SAM-dependent methyltransferase n=1 Tax=Novosphingobium sp. KCTC 2891 TaxID=2989730 RepID=UPI0022230509|nr:bifunctional glycosyltransferase/class I SAM-dependent methyltransferase [Novosphingobium sp. KCTC 2891]MCW1383276.1 bifunctional glycosyltransferase/class I SAM-dependent methyltransferase [Novosphingobium sp. KCTC 2891]
MRSVDASGLADVAVVIASYNHAHFLGDALKSVLAQTVPAQDIVVIDDGSLDDPAAVVAQHPPARIIRTANQGLPAARNNGLAAINTHYVIFLDADDVLLPGAIADGLACMKANPGAAFVCGAFRLADGDLKPRGGPVLPRLGPLGHTALLRGNHIGMPASVFYDRAKLVECGGFDPTLRRCEDYELYLRMTQRHRIASHANVVAHYRLHGSNMSLDAVEMLAWNRAILERYRPDETDAAALQAWKEGMHGQTAAFANIVWTDRGARAWPKWNQRRRMMALAPWTTTKAALRQILVRGLPGPLAEVLRGIRRRALIAGAGKIDFGDLARITPVSEGYGFRRGTPVDRFYIESFLERHAGEIRGHVLEIADDKYSRRFGKDIVRQDVLSVKDVPGATIVGDLTSEGLLPPASFDCVILTQTLQYLFDPRAAVRNLHAAMRPGGVVLATVPGITPVVNNDWEWYWPFTARAARRLFEETFGEGNVELEVNGNAFAATCFIQGIAQEDVGVQWLEPRDPSFPVNIAIRARRSA